MEHSIDHTVHTFTAAYDLVRLCPAQPLCARCRITVACARGTVVQLPLGVGLCARVRLCPSHLRRAPASGSAGKVCEIKAP